MTEEKDGQPVLRFTGQPKSEKIDFTLSYPQGYLDAELAGLFEETLKTLTLAVGATRSMDNTDGTEGRRAARELLVGFGIMAINEARAFLIVAGAGFDRHARIHFRSLMEYEFRITRIFEDDGRAIAFREAFAHEARKLARDLELANEEALEAEIEAAVGHRVDVEATGPEKRALFGKTGDVKTAMSGLLEGKKRYVGTFGWPSQIAHGSVLALREIGRATAGQGGDFLERAARDGYGNRLTYSLIWTLLHIANRLAAEFKIGIVDKVEPIARAAVKANERLGIVSPEEEEKTHKLREEFEQAKRASGQS